MKKMLSIATLLVLAAGPALAHPGHGSTASFAAGIAHPFGGLDHIAVMVAVGLWAALKGGRALWVWPAAFVGVMLIGGALGMMQHVSAWLVVNNTQRSKKRRAQHRIAPMVTPEVIMGISLLVFFTQLFGLNGSTWRSRSPTLMFCVSYVAITVRARAASLNPQLEEAARDLGASALGAFRHVTLPLLAPAIAAGAMLAFALSFDDLIVTSFNAGVGSTTLPIAIYSSIKFGVTPQINAISTIIVAIVSLALVVAWRLGAFRTAAQAIVADAEAT